MGDKRLLGIDVDLTVCPSDVGWWRYLAYKQIGISLASGDMGNYVDHVNDQFSHSSLPYALGEFFPEVQNPNEYWRTLDYSQFKPIEGTVEALEKLSQYFGIVFISQHKGTHGKTKYYWLQEYFPFNSGVILTKEKWLMNDAVVAMIDDRLSHLKNFDYEKRIQFDTIYTQDVECDVATKFNKWGDEIVHKICKEYLK